MKDWSGREIEACIRRADMLGVSLIDAAKQIIPASVSHKEQVNGLRLFASHRFLSSSHDGAYVFTGEDKAREELPTEPVVSHGRRIR